MESIEAPIEAAFSGGGDRDFWFYRITYKCPICGRRTCVLEKGKGTTMEENLPLRVRCKQGHETLVVPYRWKPNRI